ncbi:MAG: succinate dehydrogenase assembly factor 2 [Nevskiaceae bacterium]|nr:MAG: succinate dehydrogenase assembly factor 2 [Nevskiaceae bacterium]
MDKARLKWLCRRGMKELDVLLERYLAKRYDEAPEAERAAFVALMSEEDPQIWSWIMGFDALPAGETGHVIEQLRRHR